MKRVLKALVAWLDRKFPDKVVVTQKEYDTLSGRIKYLEAEVTKFNASLGFAGGLRGKSDLESILNQPRPFQR